MKERGCMPGRVSIVKVFRFGGEDCVEDQFS